MSLNAAGGAPRCALVPLALESLHDEGCFILDAHEGVFHYVGAKVVLVIYDK